jgi:hypothetical protein
VTKSNLPTPNIKELEKAFDGNLDLMLFYLTWIKNGLNGSKAYKELHPQVDDHSCRVLGSRWLARVSTCDRELLMNAYGLDREKYFVQLADGLEAQRSDPTGQVFPDHRTRAIYHDKLGKLLGIESSGETFGAEFKNGEKSIKIIVTRGYASPTI